MITQEEKLKLLKQQNPFASSSIGNPWYTTYSDIQSINRSQFERICDLIDQKNSHPQANYAAIIVGESGAGKTHLIRRLLTHHNKKNDIISVYVQPLENSEKPYQYLLREIAINLTRRITPQSQFCRLDGLMGLFLKKLIIKTKSKNQTLQTETLRKLSEDPLSVFTDPVIKQVFHSKKIKSYGETKLRKFDPEINDDFISAILNYRFPAKQAAIIKWLKSGSLSPDESSTIDIIPPQFTSESDEEQRAKELIRSLGSLMAFTEQTMIPYFDRLENLTDDEQIRSFGRLVENLIDTTQAIFPLVFLRGRSWEKSIREKLNQQIVSRLETNFIELKGCNTDESMEIIKTRLNAIFKENIGEDYFPLPQKDLCNRFSARLFTPGEVIIEANKELQNAIYDSVPAMVQLPAKELSNRYQQEITKITDNFNQTIPNHDHLKKALAIYLKDFPSKMNLNLIQIEAPSTTTKYFTDKDFEFVDFLGVVKINQAFAFKTIFLICSSENPETLLEVLRRGVKFLKMEQDGKAFFITDGRCGFGNSPNWRNTNECLLDFKHLGGKFWPLNKEESAGWYALANLYHRFKENAIAVLDSNQQTRNVTRKEFFTFIMNHLHTRRHQCLYLIDKYLLGDIETNEDVGSSKELTD